MLSIAGQTAGPIGLNFFVDFFLIFFSRATASAKYDTWISFFYYVCSYLFYLVYFLVVYFSGGFIMFILDLA